MITSRLFLQREINFSLGWATALGGSIYSLAWNLSVETNIFYLNIHLQIQSDLKEYSVTFGMAVEIFLNLKQADLTVGQKDPF